MRKRFRTFLLPLVGAALAFSPLAKADTVFTSFGAGQSYAPPGNGTPIHGADAMAVPAGYRAEAMAFTPTANYTLSQVDIALQYGGLGSNLVNLALAVDNGSGLPGTVLETWNGVVPSTTGTGVETVTPTSTISLSDGTQYWLEALPGASDTTAIWNSSSTLGNAAVDMGSGFVARNTPPVGYQIGAFDVLGDAIQTNAPAPEPSSVALALGGFTVLAGLLRRRRKA